MAAPHPPKQSFPCDLCEFKAKSKGGLTNHRGKAKCLKNKQDALNRTLQQPTSDDYSNQPFYRFIMKLQMTTSVTRHIPRAARPVVASALKKTIDACLENPATVHWYRLLVFAYGVLRVPRNVRQQNLSIPDLIKQQAADFLRTTEPTFAVPEPKGKKAKAASTSERLRKEIEARIQDGDVKGAVRMLCSDDVVAHCNPANLEIMKSKHPMRTAEEFGTDDTNAPPVPLTTPNEVYEAIRSFPNGSSGGLDGMRPQHLKDLIGHHDEHHPESLLLSITRLVHLVSEGKVPNTVRDLFFGARLISLEKKTGGLRPIAVGNVLRRLTGKVIAARLRDRMEQQFQPNQLGCCVKGGAEAAVHSARNFLRKESEKPLVFVKLDFSNAFNSLRRQKMLTEMRLVAPEYDAYQRSAYVTESVLIYGEEVVLSSDGVQQGDPLGPLCFSAAIMPLIENLKSAFNVWYLDDGCLGGDADTVAGDIQTVLDSVNDYGLRLNVEKCEFMVFGGSVDLQAAAQDIIKQSAPGILLATPDTLSLLGSPLTEQCMKGCLEKKTEEIRRLTDRLQILEDHHAYFILRNCLSIPKLQYILRTAPVWKQPALLKEFDEMTRLSLEKLFNVKAEERPWRQASLPASKAGLGLRRAEELALPAYLASVNSTAQLVDSICNAGWLDCVEEAETEWSVRTSQDPPAFAVRHIQKLWDGPMTDLAFDSLLAGCTDKKDRARLLAAATKESSAWREVRPIGSFGTFLPSNTVRISIAQLLGAPVCHPHICKCGKPVDETGIHGLSCMFSAGRRGRHDALNKALGHALGRAGFPSRLEPPGLCRDDRKRPDGMTHIPFRNGKCLVWDSTCIDTLAACYLDKTSESAGKAAEVAEQDKIDKYRELEDNYIFVPLAFETFGAWGESAKTLVKNCGKAFE